jgi:hypothetical protein
MASHQDLCFNLFHQTIPVLSLFGAEAGKAKRLPPFGCYGMTLSAGEVHMADGARAYPPYGFALLVIRPHGCDPARP